jgi:hypothetical protein
MSDRRNARFARSVHLKAARSRPKTGGRFSLPGCQHSVALAPAHSTAQRGAVSGKCHESHDCGALGASQGEGSRARPPRWSRAAVIRVLEVLWYIQQLFVK